MVPIFTEEAEPEEPEPAKDPYGRRRSRAVLYQLSGHYKSDKPKTGKLKLNNVSSLFVKRYFIVKNIVVSRKINLWLSDKYYYLYT